MSRAVIDKGGIEPGAAAFVQFDREGTVVAAQGSGSAALRLGAGGARPRSLLQLYRDHPAIVDAVQRSLAGERVAVSCRIDRRQFDLRFEPRLEDAVGPAGGLMVAVELTPKTREARARARRHQALDLRLLLDEVPAAIWAVDRDLRLIHAVGHVPEGFAGHDMRGATVFEILRSRSDPGVQHHLAALNGESRSFSYELGGRTYDVHLEPLRDDGGSIVGCVGLGVDVTSRTEAERRLEHSVSLLRGIIESTADGLLVIDRAGRVATFNRRFLTMWRIPGALAERRDDAAMRAAVLDQIDDPDGFESRVHDLYAQPQAESSDTIWFRDGRVFERYSQPQRLGDEIVGRVWSFRDVTERERLLRRAVFLAEASRLLASLHVEEALESVAHLALRYMADAVAVDLFQGEGAPRRLLSLSRDPEAPLSSDIPRLVFSGTPVLSEVGMGSRITVPLSAQRELLGAMTLASTHRRYTETDLELTEELAVRASLAIDNARLHRRAQDALRARDEFLGIAAHEIRGPVAALHLAAQALAKGELPAAAAQRALKVIEREDRRLARFVDELIDIARIREGRLHFDLEEVDLAEVVREAAVRLSPELRRSRSSLSLDTDATVTGTWDRHRLEQVAANLLANAIKFGEGRPIDVTARSRDGVATLTVRDRGLGIPRDRQPLVFEPFERAVSSRHYGGLGLGLYIARIVVEGLDGSIRVESEPGSGSTFTVELPRRRRA